MLVIILIWLAFVVAAEAITEIIVSSDMPLILWFRNLAAKHNPRFFGKLFGCGYCFSVWTAFALSWALPGHLVQYEVLDIIIKAFVLHRLSNILHEGLARWFKRLPFELVLSTFNQSPLRQDDPIVKVDDEHKE
jgi:hypothetical protein